MVDSYSPPEHTSDPSPEFDSGYLHGAQSLDQLIPVPIVTHDTDRLPPPGCPQDPVLDAPVAPTLRELLDALASRLDAFEQRVCQKVEGLYPLVRDLTDEVTTLHQEMGSRPCMVEQQVRKTTPSPGCLHVVRVVDEIE